MNTVTLEEQMQVIFDRLEEPAVINVDQYEVLGSYAEIKAAGDCGFEQHRASVVAMGNGENPSPDEDLVAVMFRCPACHERRPDYLMLNDDDFVTCQSCGEVYALPDDDDSLPLTDLYALQHPGALM